VLETLVPKVSQARGRRYPTVLVVVGSSMPPLSNIQAVARSVSLEIVDVRSLLVPASAQDQGFALGVYHRTQFRDWLRSRAATRGGLLVLNADDLISTWSPEDRRAFLMEFLHLEIPWQGGDSSPVIVLFSRHASRFDLPSEKTGQGILCHL